MSGLNYVLATLCQVVKENPASLVPILACACTVTLVVAILTDALFARKPARVEKRGLARIPRPR